jgi:hypothetical protein
MVIFSYVVNWFMMFFIDKRYYSNLKDFPFFLRSGAEVQKKVLTELAEGTEDTV